MLFKTSCAEQTESVGERLAAALFKNKKRAFIAMRGEMGVGKTAFTRGFARALGIQGVKSPTYTVVNEHRGKARLFHYDMYRLDGEDDLYSTGFDDYLSSDGYIVAEKDNVLFICKKGDSSALVRKYVNEVKMKYGDEFV
jgi:tRNA threonylcarbamoyladenosine biosynthesis protein TsaE